MRIRRTRRTALVTVALTACVTLLVGELRSSARGPASQSYAEYRADAQVCIGPSICILMGVRVFPVPRANSPAYTRLEQDGEQPPRPLALDVLLDIVRLLFLPCLPFD